MKFKLNINSTSEHDTDYDTAVDIVHWARNLKNYVLETPNGLKLILTNEKTNTTYSYLEPDYDIMDENPDSKTVYRQHADNSKNSSTNDIWLRSELPEQMIILTKQECNDYFEHYFEKDDDYRAICFNRDLLNKFENFEIQNMNYREEDSFKILTEDNELFNLLKTFNEFNDNNKLQIIEINLPESINNQVLILEKKASEINEYNSNNLIEHMSNQANAKLNRIIDKLSIDAYLAIENSFNTKDNKIDFKM